MGIDGWKLFNQKCPQFSQKLSASIACGQFLRELWTFLVKQQFSCNFHPSMPTSLHFYPQLMHFCWEISDIIEKNAFLGTFIYIWSIWICGHFSTPKIGFRTKNNFFHVWLFLCLKDVTGKYQVCMMRKMLLHASSQCFVCECNSRSECQ